MIVNGKFPVINTKPQQYIPYDVLKCHEERVNLNHGQSLEQLADRGGLSWHEILCILEDKPWGYKQISELRTEDQKLRVWKHILKFFNYQ